MKENSKFLTDASLGKLAKWLRILGYDTAIYPAQAGRAVLRIADAEKRIVLTRRQDMPERQFSGRLFLITNKDTRNQLAEVINEFSLTISSDKMFAICLVCNERLIPATKEEVRDIVPPFVFENVAKFTKCPHCQKIYWAGTHQRNSMQFLEKLSITDGK